MQTYRHYTQPVEDSGYIHQIVIIVTNLTYQNYHWSMWVLELLLKNPEVPYSTIVRSTLDKLSRLAPDFRSFIRQYAADIEEYGEEMREKLSIEFKTPPKANVLEQKKLNVSDIAKFQKYIEELRNDIVTELESTEDDN
jgi:hypothetical protein